MKISIYTTAWNILKYGFDYKDALANWSLYADEISISVGPSDDGTLDALKEEEKNFPILITQPPLIHSDPFYYGKMENNALQQCTGDLLIQQNLDERWCGDKEILHILGQHLLDGSFQAFFVPTIDLYGDPNNFVNIGRKWYIHKRGLYRGAVRFGLKSDGRPDYNKTSTDELIDKNGALVPTVSLLDNLTIDSLRAYAEQGMPYTMHLGYLNLKDRASRATWWKKFWEEATGGDPNKHVTSEEELLKRATKAHGLPLWKTTNSK